MKAGSTIHVSPVFPWHRGRTRLLAWMARHDGAEKLVTIFTIVLN